MDGRPPGVVCVCWFRQVWECSWIQDFFYLFACFFWREDYHVTCAGGRGGRWCAPPPPVLPRYGSRRVLFVHSPVFFYLFLVTGLVAPLSSLALSLARSLPLTFFPLIDGYPMCGGHHDVNATQAGLELDMLREQVAVHKSEFAEMEASTTRKTSELQLLLEGERDKACILCVIPRRETYASRL